jgi:hypothetical protein
MKKKAHPILFNLQEVDQLILRILSRNPLGLTADKIRRDLPPSHRVSKDQLLSRLESLISSGNVRSWAPSPGREEKPVAPIYSLESLEPVIQKEILKQLKGQLLTPAQIKKSFPLPVNRYLPIFWAPLLRDRSIKWHPPLKGKRLGLQDPDPAIFLSAEIKKLLDKGGKLGFPAETILQAIRKVAGLLPLKAAPSRTAEEEERIIFQAMAAIKPAAAQGALVYIPDLRKAVANDFPAKESFDRAILRLAEREKVQLQSHSLPAELTEEERTAMIDNGRGSFFMAIGMRVE